MPGDHLSGWLHAADGGRSLGSRYKGFFEFANVLKSKQLKFYTTRLLHCFDHGRNNKQSFYSQLLTFPRSQPLLTRSAPRQPHPRHVVAPTILNEYTRYSPGPQPPSLFAVPAFCSQGPSPGQRNPLRGGGGVQSGRELEPASTVGGGG